MAVIFLAVLYLATSVLCLPLPGANVTYDFPFMTREQWGGRPPKNIKTLNIPVPFVVIHHTYIPRACFTVDECSASMRKMQNHHQLTLGWDDIGYNFAVSSDGTVYEGKGWHAVGAHAYGYNSRSIGVSLIGDWGPQAPPHVQLNTTKSLIQEGVRRGVISETYQLIGHRQVRATECPGQALFTEISTWDRFQPNV